MEITFKTIRMGVLISASIMLFGKLLSLATSVAFARIGGSTVYGQLVIFLAWVNIVSFVVGLGLNNVSLKFIPAYHENSRWEGVKGILLVSHLLVSVAAIVMALAVAFLIKSEILKFPAYVLQILPIAFIMIFVNCHKSLMQATLRSYGFIFWAKSPRLIFRPILVLLFIYLFYLFEKYSYVDFVVIVFIGGFVTFMQLVYLCFRFVWKHIKCNSIYEFEAWKKVAIPFFILSGINLIVSQTDIVMLGYFHPPEKVAKYSVALDISSILIFTLTAVTTIVVPLISRSYSTNDISKLNVILNSSLKILLCISTVFLIILIFFGKNILSIYGSEYSDSYFVLLILAFGYYVNAVVGPIGSVLNMTDAQTVVTKVVGVSALINVFLNLLLIPSFGTYGAAVATVTSLIFWNIYLYFYWNNVHKDVISNTVA